MPYVKHIPIHPGTHLKNCLKYMDNPEKAAYTTAINCPDDIDAAIDVFRMFGDFDTKTDKDGDKEERIAHHYVQSFEPGKVSAEEAHNIGVELARIIAPGYMCHVATHVDKEHIHNHIFIFSVHPETGYKYLHNDDQYKFVQQQSDAICMERGIGVIENPKKRGLSIGEYRALERGDSWKDKLAWDIDDAVKSAVDNSTGREGFIEYLRSKGYEIKWQNKNISIKLPGNKAIRVDRLAKTYGSRYTKENIERRLRGEELIPDYYMNCEVVEELPRHMKYGDPERFNEYDRYLNWCMRKGKEAVMEVRKRSPPDLEIYKPMNKEQKQLSKEGKDSSKSCIMRYETKEAMKESKGERKKGGESRKIRSFRDKLVCDIDDAIKSAVANSSGREGFISYLRAQGYIVKYQNKNISIQIPGRKAIRVDNLAKTHGKQYTKENIEKRLEGQYQNSYDEPSRLPYEINKEKHEDGETVANKVSSRRWINLFGTIKTSNWNKYGKTKDEREIEKEMEEIGRVIGRAIRRRRLKAKPMKGTWTMRKTIDKKKRREKERQV